LLTGIKIKKIAHCVGVTLINNWKWVWEVYLEATGYYWNLQTMWKTVNKPINAQIILCSKIILAYPFRFKSRDN